MTFIAAVATIGSSLIGASAAGDAADATRDAARENADLNRYMYDTTRADQMPFRDAGLAGQNRILTLLGLSGGDQNNAAFGRYGRDFNMSDFEGDPGYQFRLSEGLKALDRAAAARGGFLGGGALRSGQRYAQDVASGEFQNAFNRYQVNRANQLNPLQSLSGASQTATNAIGSAGQQYASNAGNAIMAGGNARASGYMGRANALASGISGAYNQYQNQQLLNSLMNQSRTSTMSNGYSISAPAQSDLQFDPTW